MSDELNHVDFPIGVLELDDRMIVRAVNPAFRRLFAVSAAEVVGRPLDEFLSLRDRRGTREFHRRVSRGEPIDMLLGLALAGRDYLARLRLIGRPGGQVAVIEKGDGDLLADLYGSQRRLEQIIKKSVEGVVILDPQNHILEHNDRFFELMRFRVGAGVVLAEDALQGSPLFALLDPQVFGPLAVHLGAEATRHTRFGAVVAHGDRWLDVATTPIVLPLIGFAGTCVVFRDITDQRQAELLLRQKEAAEAASIAKSRFLANMSHELRTPLNAIIGYSEMLIEDAEVAPEVAEDLRKICASGTHLLALINNILDLSKIEAGKMELWPEEFSVPSLVDGVLATIEPLAARRGNQLRVVCPRSVGVMRSDLLKVRQVLLNLLSNAAKFTSEGTITLTVRRADDRVEFEVADTGVGISPESLRRLFEDFEQADAATARDFGGTGLGLALSRRFCRLMGGDVDVASELGRGSIFTVSLPARIDGPRVTATDDAEEPRAPAAAPPRVAPPARPASAPPAVLVDRPARDTVLVLDDDPAVLDLMIRFLDREGLAAVAASSPAAALALARALRPAAITVDVVMPEADGWQVLAALKAAPDLADIPVIMVSITDDQQRGLRLGAADYLVKPIDRDRLLAVLARHRRGAAAPTVLVVDDDAAARARARAAIEREGYRVVEAEHGGVALAALRSLTPDLILLDLMMPEVDGFAFLDQLRARPEWRSIPVVVLTAKDLSAGDRRRLASASQEVLSKSSTRQGELLDELRRVLQAARR